MPVSLQFDWQNIKPPNIPFHDIVIYEMSVRHFTADPSSGLSDEIRCAILTHHSSISTQAHTPFLSCCVNQRFC